MHGLHGKRAGPANPRGSNVGQNASSRLNSSRARISVRTSAASGVEALQSQLSALDAQLSNLPPHYATTTLKNIAQDALPALRDFQGQLGAAAPAFPSSAPSLSAPSLPHIDFTQLVNAVTQLGAELQARMAAALSALSSPGDWVQEPHWGSHSMLELAKQASAVLSAVAEALAGGSGAGPALQMLQERFGEAIAGLQAALAPLQPAVVAGQLSAGAAAAVASLAAAADAARNAMAMPPHLDVPAPEALAAQLQALAAGLKGVPEALASLNSLPAPFLGGYDPLTIGAITAGAHW